MTEDVVRLRRLSRLFLLYAKPYAERFKLFRVVFGITVFKKIKIASRCIENFLRMLDRAKILLGP